MNKYFKFLAMGLVTSTVVSVFAAPPSSIPPDLDAEKIKRILATQVDGVVKMPATAMNLIEANGKTFLVSDNGRIVITGKMYDMWNGVELKNVSDVQKFAYKIDVSKLGLNLDDLGVINIGAGKKEIIAFIDPHSPPSHKFIQTVSKLNQYTLKLIMIPGPEIESQDKVKKATCVKEKAQVAKALIDNSWDKLLADSKECDLLQLQKAIITSRIFGVNPNSLPYVIRQDGQVGTAPFKNIEEWLGEDGKNIEAQPSQAKASKSKK